MLEIYVLLLKFEGLETGNSLSDPKHITLVEPVAIPNPIMYVAVHRKIKMMKIKYQMLYIDLI